MPRLVVIHGPDLGKQFELGSSPVTVGRHSSNPIHLHDSGVSRKHFELVPMSSRWILKDLGSGNGTRVNSQVVQSIELHDGDRIQINETVLAFQADQGGSTHLTRAASTGQSSASVQLYATPEQAFRSSIVSTISADAGSKILANPSQAVTDWLRGRLASLTVLYEATHAVSDILDVDELLERIMKLLIPAADADRGCVMLTDPETGELMPKAVQTRSLTGGDVAVSRTVIDHVLKEKHGVLIADAMVDERFRSGASVQAHNLREVICVPMRGRHETVGVLFLDTKAESASTATKFTEDHLQLAVAVAHHAALAVEETRYYQAMVNAERLAAIGQTIAAMSHHIKNIMQGVRFGSDMVRAALACEDRELLLKGWKLVEKNQNRIDDLILDMLSYSKEREPNIESTDLGKLLEDVLDLLRGRIQEKAITLSVRVAESLPKVACDPEGLHRAMLNVLSNAIDALETRENASLDVSIQLSSDGKSMEIGVTDNGPGIPAEKREDIFKPFFSSKGSRGTGLGLPVSRKIMLEHGGDLRIDPAYDQGCRFIFELPVRDSAS